MHFFVGCHFFCFISLVCAEWRMQQHFCHTTCTVIIKETQFKIKEKLKPKTHNINVKHIASNTMQCFLLVFIETSITILPFSRGSRTRILVTCSKKQQLGLSLSTPTSCLVSLNSRRCSRTSASLELHHTGLSETKL